MGSYGAYLVETSLTLLAVCALAFVVLWGTRRLGMGRARGPVQLCGQLALDARRSIYLVKVGTQVIIVGVAEGGFTKLGELSADSLPTALPPPRFSDVLARVIGKGRPAYEDAEVYDHDGGSP